MGCGPRHSLRRRRGVERRAIAILALIARPDRCAILGATKGAAVDRTDRHGAAGRRPTAAAGGPRQGPTGARRKRQTP